MNGVGELANRLRLDCAIIRAIRLAVGEDFIPDIPPVDAGFGGAGGDAGRGGADAASGSGCWRHADQYRHRLA